MAASLHLNHITRRTGLLYFFHPRDHILRKLIQRLRMWRCLAIQCHWFSVVATLADVRIKFNRSQERHAELHGGFGYAALRENVDLLMAMRTQEVAHVLHQSQYVHARCAKHLNRLATILKRNIGWR